MEMAGFEPVKACSTSSNCDLNSDTFLYILAIAMSAQYGCVKVKLAHGEGGRCCVGKYYWTWLTGNAHHT